jgi:hypothetical protein
MTMTPDEQARYDEYLKQVKAEQGKPLKWWQKAVNWIWVHTLGAKDA